MKKPFMLFIAMVTAMLLSACSGLPVASDAAAQEATVAAATSAPVTSSPAPASDEEALTDLFGELFDTLDDYPYDPYYGGYGCDMWSYNCLYDPFYGSCEWDYWRGVYVCDSYHYRPGYDCAYDWWWDEYVCREGDGYGGYGSTWGW